jgi:hypothetical protein
MMNDERKDLWHASAAGEMKVARNLKAIANLIAESGSDRASGGVPVSLLGGFIYSITENVDVDIGVKAGLSQTETDFAVLSGFTVRF